MRSASIPENVTGMETAPAKPRAGARRVALLVFATALIVPVVFAAESGGVGVPAPLSPVSAPAPVSTPAPAMDVRVEVSLAPEEIFAGEPVEARLTVRWKTGCRIYPFLPPKKMGEFELISSGKASEPVRTKDGEMEQVFPFRVTCFETGEHALPPLEISYVSSFSPGGTLLSAKSAAKPVRVKSALEALKSPGADKTTSGSSVEEDLADDLKLLRPVPPPLEKPLDSGFLAMVAGGIAGALLLLYGAWRLLKRYLARESAAAPPPPPLEPDEEALRALARLELENAAEREPVKVFYSALSEVLRRYLGRRYEIDALEMTTEELLARLRSLGWAGEMLRVFAGDAGECDSVKFAKYVPDFEARRAALECVRTLVERTRPLPPEDAAS